ncbi:hypothetical protein KKH05_01080 [Patescibacteria group bacterium]|nr:hypothetical protein [Patescibacteria group bacterium]
MQNLLKKIKDKLIKYRRYSSPLLFFLWGVILLLISTNLGNPFLTILFFIILNSLVVAIFYLSFASTIENGKDGIGIAIGSIACLLTIFMDILLLF